MFRIELHNELTGFQKLAYIVDEIGLSRDEIAEVIGEPPGVVREILNSGSVPDGTPNAAIIADNLYLLRTLFSSLLRLSRYDVEKAQLLLDDTREFKGCIEEPPWYHTGDSLRSYIAQGKNRAVREALDWFSSH
jgi:hypothetical protein